MGLLNKIFKKASSTQDKLPISHNEPEHAVIVRFQYGIQGLQALHELEDKLEHITTQNAVGEYDGHEIAKDYSDGLLYMYGPNAERLFKAVQSTLREAPFMKGAIAILRFGPPEDGVKEIEVAI
jgi:hypothetical protein